MLKAKGLLISHFLIVTPKLHRMQNMWNPETIYTKLLIKSNFKATDRPKA